MDATAKSESDPDSGVADVQAQLRASLQEIDQLHRNEAQFVIILDAISDMVFCKGPKSKITWVNKAARDFYGMTQEQLKGIVDSPINEPDNTLQYIKDDAYVFETGKTLEIPDEPVVRFDGVTRHFHTVKSAIRDAQGRVQMTVGVSRDISEKLSLGAMVRQADKMSAVGLLASGVAHELNNPLGVILGFAQSALHHVTQGHILEAPLQSIQRETIRCRNLVKDLLTFSRVSKIEKERVDLNEITRYSLSLVRYRTKMTGTELVEVLAPDCPPILGNSNQLQQIIINLTNNAIDAMVSNGKLTVQTFKLQEGARVWAGLRVTDTGPGISKEDLSRIFDPFFTTKVVGQGTGLGLGLVHEIVTNHQGTVAVESRPGNTEFLVKFPFLHAA